MSPHSQPVVPRNDNRPATVQAAHAHLAERIGENKPHHMRASHVADADDFEGRAEHLRRLWIAVEDYTRAVLVDLARSSNVYVDTAVIGAVSDTRGDIVGSLTNAAEELRGVAR